MSDKKKILILRISIAFIAFLIALFLIVAIIDLSSPDGKGTFLGTTTRRTVPKTTNDSDLTITTSTVESTNNNGTKTTTTKNNNSNSNKTTNTKNSTSKISKVTSSSVSVTSPIPVTPNYEEASGKSDYKNALDSWEWDIVNKINEERIKNGLNPLIVAKELRLKAETAADKMYLEGEEEASLYLEGYNNYRISSINLASSANEFYKSTINAINITTNKYAKYIGVGVIYRETGIAGRMVYNYCLIYE